MAIVDIVDEKHFSNLKKRQYLIDVKEEDEWKFRRWIEAINAYDNSRKSTDIFNKVINEIQEDYNKDFKDDDLW